MRKSYPRPFLYVFGLLMLFTLSVPALARDKKDRPDREKGDYSSISPMTKLNGSLQDLVEIYRIHPKATSQDLQRNFYAKMRPALLTVNRPERTPERTVKIAASADPIGRPIPKPENRIPILDALIHQDVQERWGNPGFDVLLCYVTTSNIEALKNNGTIRVTAALEGENETIATAEIPSTELENVAALPYVKSVDPILKDAPSNDLMTAKTGVDAIRMREGKVYTKGYTGKGVIVGIIDTGVDWTHEDFIDPTTGKSRILYFWDSDTTTPGKTPKDVFGGVLGMLNTGTVYTNEEINNGLVPSTGRDTNGHGTHVAGIAAGNGSATGNYTGMAPNADLIVVQGLTRNGAIFIYDIADRLGRPSVLNMSFGPSRPIPYMANFTSSYPVDGTDNGSQLMGQLNALYGPGHISVKSAGNEGHWNTYTDRTGGNYPYKDGGYHSGASLAGASNHIFKMPDFAAYWNGQGWGDPYFTSVSDNDFPYVRIGFWYDSAVSITITSPNGFTYGPFNHGTYSGAESTDGYVSVKLNNTPNALNGNYYGNIYMAAAEEAVPFAPVQGNWTITVTPTGSGSGYIDFWAANFEVYNGGSYFMDTNLSLFAGLDKHSMYITDSCSPNEITVGSWTTRNLWPSILGGVYGYQARPWIGPVSDFSSPGPTRTRVMKPDISAPGDIIISALSSSISPTMAYVNPDGKHQAMSGTSMSSPSVTGGVALYLEKYPNRTVDGVISALAANARKDSHVQGYGPDAFGYGKLDLTFLNEAPIARISSSNGELILDEKQTASFDGSLSSDYEKFPLTYSWSLLSQPSGANGSFSGSGSSATLTPDYNVEGTYTVQLIVNDGTYDSAPVTATVSAKFYPVLPPTAAKVERLVNDKIFFKEYINKVTWQANPQNKVTITGYKVYKKVKGAADSSYQLVTQMAANAFSYEERGLKADQLYTYKITSLSSRGKESDPVSVSN